MCKSHWNFFENNIAFLYAPNNHDFKILICTGFFFIKIEIFSLNQNHTSERTHVIELFYDENKSSALPIESNIY